MRYFDLHCDTILACETQNLPLLHNHLHVDMERGSALGAYAQCFAVFIEDSLPREQAFPLFLRAAGRLRAQCEEHADRMLFCTEPGDLTRAGEANKIAAILMIENGAALAGSLAHLEQAAALGVKLMTLTWNGENELGGGAGTDGKTGLKPFGREALRKMEELGVIADVSHACDRLFYDVAEYSTGPIVASHSNARAVCPHRRNLTDEQFAVIRQKEGLVGLNFYRSFLREDADRADITDILRHAEHFLSLGGENVLAMGGDFDGAEMPIGIRGLQSVPDLYEAFLRENYPETLLDKIFFQNAQSFFIRNNLL